MAVDVIWTYLGTYMYCKIVLHGQCLFFYSCYLVNCASETSVYSFIYLFICLCVCLLFIF